MARGWAGGSGPAISAQARTPPLSLRLTLFKDSLFAIFRRIEQTAAFRSPSRYKAFTEKFPPDGARRPETERPCAGRVFPCAPGSTPGGAGVAVFLPPFQANPQAPSSLIYGVLFSPPQFLFL